LAKSFGTTISPWVVTLEALAPFLRANEPQEVTPPSYLQHSDPFTIDVHLEVAIRPEDSNADSIVCRSNMKHLYWTMKQQLAHHSVGGCNMRPGDLLASGTISGEDDSSFGSMLELSWKGSKPVVLTKEKSSTERKFLKDGDTVTIRGFGNGASGQGKVGFGLCQGKILPAHII